ncbi:hypothetical protein PR003_g7785 [Phytophthora rubi]|uniref:Uncharacterized protein n=1 Tax=Phytophthora rubi TaxID=129364 RepID=A0A6A4FCY4_9STRA|nr:hypothetical protein PR003_g7785 [Phytophthora rubi]
MDGDVDLLLLDLVGGEACTTPLVVCRWVTRVALLPLSGHDNVPVGTDRALAEKGGFRGSDTEEAGLSPPRGILTKKESCPRWKTGELSLKYREEGVALGDTAYVGWEDAFRDVEEHGLEPVAATTEHTTLVSIAADLTLYSKHDVYTEEKGQSKASQDLSAKEIPTRSRYDRLFTDDEMDAMKNDQGGTVHTNSEVAHEHEEYDMELEDRMYP